MSQRQDRLLLAVGIAAVSTAAPLIREADAPALAVAAWRNLFALPVVAAVVVLGRRRHRLPADAATRRLIALAGLLLAAHFATWVPSLRHTSVASSVALVATQPVWAATLAHLRGEPVGRRTWAGILVALAGVVMLSGVDLSVSAEALGGDALALAGGMLAAGYVVVGAQVRRTVTTSAYTLGCYGIAGVLLGVVTMGSGQAMAGYSRSTWLVLVALTFGPQLLGHSVFNNVLPRVGATVVSVAILAEVLGSSLLAWLFFDEVPPLAALPAGVLLLAGLMLVVTAEQAPTPPTGGAAQWSPGAM